MQSWKADYHKEQNHIWYVLVLTGNYVISSKPHHDIQVSLNSSPASWCLLDKNVLNWRANELKNIYIFVNSHL